MSILSLVDREWLIHCFGLAYIYPVVEGRRGATARSASRRGLLVSLVVELPNGGYCLERGYYSKHKKAWVRSDNRSVRSKLSFSGEIRGMATWS